MNSALFFLTLKSSPSFLKQEVCPMLVVLDSLDLNARVSLANLVKFPLLKLSELLKVNEAEVVAAYVQN